MISRDSRYSGPKDETVISAVCHNSASSSAVYRPEHVSNKLCYRTLPISTLGKLLDEHELDS